VITLLSNARKCLASMSIALVLSFAYADIFSLLYFMVLTVKFDYSFKIKFI